MFIYDLPLYFMRWKTAVGSGGDHFALNALLENGHIVVFHLLFRTRLVSILINQSSKYICTPTHTRAHAWF